MPGFDRQRSVAVSQREDAHREKGRPDKLVQHEFEGFLGVPGLVVNGRERSQQSPGPEGACHCSEHLRKHVESELAVAFVDPGAYGDEGVDVAASDFASEADGEEEGGGDDDIGSHVEGGGTAPVGDDEAAQRLEEDYVEPSALGEAVHYYNPPSARLLTKFQNKQSLHATSSNNAF